MSRKIEKIDIKNRRKNIKKYQLVNSKTSLKGICTLFLIIASERAPSERIMRHLNVEKNRQ